VLARERAKDVLALEAVPRLVERQQRPRAIRQQFGLGLSAAILLDATLVRAVLVPAVMKIMGVWNWYLPAGVRRALRVPGAPARATD